jgi:AraC family transcriptional regulator
VKICANPWFIISSPLIQEKNFNRPLRLISTDENGLGNQITDASGQDLCVGKRADCLPKRKTFRYHQGMQSEYQKRLNRVIDYIDTHLGEELDLEQIASVAAFSKYHFHRIFSSLTGEPLGSYIQRLRLERAASQIVSRPDLSLTTIGLELQFSSSAVFSRAFKDRFGMSPSDWRAGGWSEHGKNCKLMSNRYQPVSKYREAAKVSSGYSVHRNQQWRITMNTETQKLDYTVEVRDIPAKTVAYVRHTGPYAGDAALFQELFGRLLKWAGPRNLFDGETSELLTIYHDSPEITEEEKLRISVCLTVPEGTEVSGDVGLMSIPAGRYAVGTFAIDVEQYGDAWNSLFGAWLPESGYQCTDGFCYELSLNDPDTDPEGKHRVAIHIPVKPL